MTKNCDFENEHKLTGTYYPTDPSSQEARGIAQEEAKLANENTLLNTTAKTLPLIKKIKRKLMQFLLGI